MNLIFRKALEKDLEKIVIMLKDDILGKTRETALNLAPYQKAFAEISSDKNHFLAVVEFENEAIATCHLTLIPSLSLNAAKRMTIEAVRVDQKFRNQQIGSWMIKQALDFAKKNDVKLVQLTSNKKREKALQFYQKLGFKNSHEGFKFEI